MIHFDVSGITSEINLLKEETNKEGFWNFPEKSTNIITKLKKLEKKLDEYIKLENNINNLEGLNQLFLEENDEEMCKELLKETYKLESEIEKLEIETLLNGKYDKNNAILTLHPGARRDRITRLGTNALQNVLKMGKFKWIFI